MTTHSRIATAEQVRAFLAGTKTQWREPVVRRNSDSPVPWGRLEFDDAKVAASGYKGGPNFMDGSGGREQYLQVAIRPHPEEPPDLAEWTRDRIYPRVGIGDVLRFRETWNQVFASDSEPVTVPQECFTKTTKLIYRASNDTCVKWRSPATMPAWACRLTSTVTAVRVEQVAGVWFWVYDLAKGTP